jgi:SAM-dependent methyltransferase
MAKVVGGRVYALDLDPEMILRAKAETARQGISVLGWMTADARGVAELLPEQVDFVLIANTFHGVPDQLGLAKLVAKVLKPSGLLAIVNWHPAPREQTTVLGQPRGPKTEMRMSPDAVRAVVEPAGFRLAHLVELRPYHYGAVFERTA